MLEDVLKTIDKNRDLYISWLQELCRQPSVAAQNRGMAETASLVERYLESIGAKVERLATAGYPVVYGEIGGESAKTLSFYNHYDVQPEDPVDLWESGPFEADICDGRIYARGVADNKGNLMARIAAVHAYRQTRGVLPLKVKFIVEGEEEIGSPNLEAFADAHADRLQADGCIWEFGYKSPEGKLQVSLGVKGICYARLRVKGAKTDLHSANAAIVTNPAWRLVWALSTLKNDREEVLIEGFYDRVLPPTEEEREILEAMAYEEGEMLKHLELDTFLLDLSGNALKEKLVFQPTCTVCGLESGYTGEGSKTVLPSRAMAKLDFRLVPDQDHKEVLALLRRHLDKHGFRDIEVIDLTGEHPAKTDPRDPLVASVLKSAERVYGQAPTVSPMSPGSGPMYALCQKRGIPAVSVGVGHSQSQNHAPNENIFVEDYLSGIKMIAAVMDDYAQTGER